MIDNKYIDAPKGIPLVAFNFVFDFKQEKYLSLTNDRVMFTHLHNHRDFEIIYIEKGTATFLINGEEIKALENDIVMINPYDLHYSETNKNQDSFSYYCIDFDIDFLKDSYTYSDFSPMLMREEMKINPIIKNTNLGDRIKEITNLYVTAPLGWELLAKANLLILFSYVFKNNLWVDVSPSQKNDFARNVIKFINENFQYDITSQDAAEFLSYNQSYFCRTFKNTFSYTFREYLSIVRIEKAKEFIKNGKGNISEIARLSGFENLSWFAKTFKKHTGISPSEYSKHNTPHKQ